MAFNLSMSVQGGACSPATGHWDKEETEITVWGVTSVE